MTHIKALTPAQQALLAEMAAEGRKVGNCTDPAHRPRAEAAIAGLYHQAGCPAPRFLWAGSPLTGQILMNLLIRKGRQLAHMLPGLQMGGRGYPLGAPVWDKLRSTMHSNPRVSLRESLKSTLDPALERTLRSSLWVPLDDV